MVISQKHGVSIRTLRAFFILAEKSTVLAAVLLYFSSCGFIGKSK